MTPDQFIRENISVNHADGITKPYYFKTIDSFLSMLSKLNLKQILAIVVDCRYTYEVTITANRSNGEIYSWIFRILLRKDQMDDSHFRFRDITTALPKYFMQCNDPEDNLIVNYINPRLIDSLEIEPIEWDYLKRNKYSINFRNPIEGCIPETKAMTLYSNNPEFDLIIKLNIKTYAPLANIIIY